MSAPIQCPTCGLSDMVGRGTVDLACHRCRVFFTPDGKIVTYKPAQSFPQDGEALKAALADPATRPAAERLARLLRRTGTSPTIVRGDAGWSIAAVGNTATDYPTLGEAIDAFLGITRHRYRLKLNSAERDVRYLRELLDIIQPAEEA